MDFISLLNGKQIVLRQWWFSFFVSFSTQGINRGPSKVIDVTVPVQCQVKDSRLFLTESSKVRYLELVFLLFRLAVKAGECQLFNTQVRQVVTSYNINSGSSTLF